MIDGDHVDPFHRSVARFLLHDVGLELLALLILLCLSIVRASSTLRSACAKLVLFFQEKRKGKKRTAVIDARHRTGQRGHDMAAGATLNNL